MRRIRYALAASLDGDIAGPRGESNWIALLPPSAKRIWLNLTSHKVCRAGIAALNYDVDKSAPAGSKEGHHG